MLNIAEVARSAGLELKAKGSRLWACCPLHGEKTPSMCFFPDGRFHCFGCGADGDAADLYAALHGVPLTEALRVCRGESYTPNRKTSAELTREKVERWYAAEWAIACREKHATMSSMEQTAPDSASFWNHAKRHAEAVDRLNHLESVKDDPIGKTILFKEATSERARTA